MEDKRIDYNAPLLSVRRFHSSISKLKSRAAHSGHDAVPQPSGSIPTPSGNPPSYKSDLKSGPVRSPGVVPFVWEDAPGFPKAGSSTPPSSVSVSAAADPPVPKKLPELGSEKGVVPRRPAKEDAGEGEGKIEGDVDEEEDAFSDALETLSRSDSCFMNCSVSGMTGVAGSVPMVSGFSADPQVRDFMMGRFLPAAQAMATESLPHANARKAVSSGNGESVSVNVENGSGNGDGEVRRTAPRQKPQVAMRYHLQNHHLPVVEDSDDDSDDYGDSGQMAMKGCGFLPRLCMKGSLSLMNSVPGARVRGAGPLRPARRRSPVVKPPKQVSGSVGKIEKKQMQEVVSTHKPGGGDQMQVDNASKLSESNRLTYWSESASPDGSSPYRRSTGGGSFSPYRNDPSQSPLGEGKGFLGFPKGEGRVVKADSLDSGSRGSDMYFEIQPNLIGKGGSEMESPNSARAARMDPDAQGSQSSKLTSPERKELPVAIRDENLEVAVDNGRMRVLVDSNSEVGVFAESDARSKEFNQEVLVDALVAVKLDDERRNDYDSYFQPVLPPPLPKTPSESWLSRTLPSVSSNQAAFLGIKFHSKKNGDQISSSAFPKREAVVKFSNVHTTQLRFSEVLANPIKEDG